MLAGDGGSRATTAKHGCFLGRAERRTVVASRDANEVWMAGSSGGGAGNERSVTSGSRRTQHDAAQPAERPVALRARWHFGRRSIRCTTRFSFWLRHRTRRARYDDWVTPWCAFTNAHRIGSVCAAGSARSPSAGARSQQLSGREDEFRMSQPTLESGEPVPSPDAISVGEDPSKEL